MGELVAATVRGLQSAGVAAGLKHFPGLGDVADDSHHELPTLDLSPGALALRELVPFRAGIAAGARVVMSAHLAVPSLTGDASSPATLSRRVMTGLLRDELGFQGVSITDALDMGALDQATIGSGAVAALRAGIDLLMTAPDPAARGRIEQGLTEAASQGLLAADDAARSAARLATLHRWLAGFPQLDLSVVRSAAHLELADELATRSITLVRDDDGLMPLRLAPGARILAIQPLPPDQTPADTTSTVAPGLASALREQFAAVDEIVVPHAPSPDGIAAVRDAARAPDVSAVVVGTSAAFLEPAQAALVESLLSTGRPVVTVALRTPLDLAAYPAARCHVATYGILPPTLRALAAALAGAAPFQGRLPAAIPGLHVTGHGLVTEPAPAAAGR